MVYPDFNRFRELAQDGNFIPVYQEVVADLDTPVSAWYRVCQGQPYSFLLESVEGGESVGRYSFLGSDPLWILEVRGERAIQRFRDGRELLWEGDPFQTLASCLDLYKPVMMPELPPSIGGLFGYWGYEMIRWIEPTVPIFEGTAADFPDGLFMQVDSILVFDQVKRQIWVVAFAYVQEDVQGAYQEAVDRVGGLLSKLQSSFSSAALALKWQARPAVLGELACSVTPEQYCQSVRQAKEYIRAGDIFQVVLSQQFKTPFRGDPFQLYRSLRLVNPSPYMAFMQFQDFYLIGSSPEVMVRLDLKGEQRLACVRPIAGTRPRGSSMQEDKTYADDLLRDPKELAEHTMLVDLGRNDLGRVCQPGSVLVNDLMTIEKYSHVMHIVSNVIGDLPLSKTAWDLLKATFPAGTVTGAPKIRAMQIIYELEGIRRGPYSGAYGYYDFSGQLNTAITLRTLWIKDQVVTLQAGAGIVADSDPVREQEECLNKARGPLAALASLD